MWDRTEERPEGGSGRAAGGGRREICPGVACCEIATREATRINRVGYSSEHGASERELGAQDPIAREASAPRERPSAFGVEPRADSRDNLRVSPQPKSRSERRFFLATSPDQGEPKLAPEDQEHALRVLRLEPGELILGLDGRGRAWPLEVTGVEKRSLTLESRGEALFEPRPGDPGSPLGWIEIALVLPKPARQTETIERLTQLGACRILPLATERATDVARTISANRLEKLARASREACKQSRRLWTVQIDPVSSLKEVLAAAPGDLVRLDANGDTPLCNYAASLASHAQPTLFIGPEGGFTPAECELIDSSGAVACRLTPTILRIETAAELAVGTLAQALGEKQKNNVSR